MSDKTKREIGIGTKVVLLGMIEDKEVKEALEKATKEGIANFWSPTRKGTIVRYELIEVSVPVIKLEDGEECLGHEQQWMIEDEYQKVIKQIEEMK